MRDPNTLVGQVLADTYQVESLLATGGMGSVYRGRHLRTGGLCAIKLLLPEAARNTELYGRFLDEARIIAALRHPNIVQVSDFNYTADRTPFLVMELLEGEDLEVRLQHDGRLGLPQALKIARQVGEAIQAAHDHGVVHRDLKPRNIYLACTQRGGTHVKVIDFGVSKIPRPQGRATQELLMLGTPQYAAPEVALGQNSEIDGRADQYSLAAILYRALSGKLPLEQGAGEDLIDFLRRVGSAPPPPLRQLVPEAPPHVEQALARALAKRKADRFPTMIDFVHALEGATGPERTLRDTLGGGGGSSRGAPAAQTMVRSLNFRRVLLAGLLGATAGALALSFVLLHRPPPGDRGGRKGPGALPAEESGRADVERFRGLLGGGRVKEALGFYHGLPAGAPARAELSETEREAFSQWAGALLSQAEDAQQKGQCRTAWQRAQDVLSIEPEHPQALSIKWRDCGVTSLTVSSSFSYRQAGYPPLRRLSEAASAPEPDRPLDTEQVLQTAQRLHARKRYSQALTLANSVVGLDRLNYMRAYRIIGASACALGKGPLLRYVAEHVDSPSRDFLGWACPGADLGAP